MATTRVADGLAHEPMVHVRRCYLLLLGDNSALATLKLRARDVETTRQRFVAVELGFGLWALRGGTESHSFLPRDSQPAHFSPRL